MLKNKGGMTSEKLNDAFYDNYFDAKSEKEKLKEQFSRVKKNLRYVILVLFFFNVLVDKLVENFVK